MFTVNSQTNRISPVKTKRFSELGFTERKHLQEWVKANKGTKSVIGIIANSYMSNGLSKRTCSQF